MKNKGMCLIGEKVSLRRFMESDIEDFIRWNTSEIEWKEWDAPWENEMEHPFDAEKYRRTMRERLRKHSDGEKPAVVCNETERSAGADPKMLPNGQPKSLPTLQICVNDEEGEHIGWVSSYFIDEEYRFICGAGQNGAVLTKDGACRAKDGVRLAIGIDIPVLGARRKGYAEEAWTLYMDYARSLGFGEVYTQTWSGNHRALGLIRKLGFKEVDRNKDDQTVRGEFVDGLTFQKTLGINSEMIHSSSLSLSPSLSPSAFGITNKTAGFHVYIVNAFTHQGKGGNQAGVILMPAGGFPPEHIMQNVASKLGFSETAFVVKLMPRRMKGTVCVNGNHTVSGHMIPDWSEIPIEGFETCGGRNESGEGDDFDTADFHIRYFTPTDEVDFCGHATIAAFEVLRKLDSAEPAESESPWEQPSLHALSDDPVTNASLFHAGLNGVHEGLNVVQKERNDFPRAEDAHPGSQRQRYSVRTGAGIIRVELGEDGGILIEMDAPTVVRTLDFGEYEELIRIMRPGIDPENDSGITPAPSTIAERSKDAREADLSMTDSASDAARVSCTASANRRDSVDRSDGVQVKLSADALTPVIVSAGLTDIILPLRSREELNALNPDFAKLSEFSRRLGVVGVHAFAFGCVSSPSAEVVSEYAVVTMGIGDSKDADALGAHRVSDHYESCACVVYARNFAPLYGIDEEAATGTSNAGLTQYLYECGRISAGERNTILQGERMNATSEIRTRVSAGEEAVSDGCICGCRREKKEGTENRIQVGGFGTIVEEVSIDACEMRAIAFLDRDGTIIRDYPDEEWGAITEPEFMEGAIEGMQALAALGFQFIVVTNQYIIADGIITLEEYESVQGKFLDTLHRHGIEVLKTYYCPHNDADACDCKKPLPGMIHRARDEFEIDMSRSILCGNTDGDYLLANHFGLPFYGVQYEGSASVKRFRSLLEVAKRIADGESD